MRVGRSALSLGATLPDGRFRSSYAMRGMFIGYAREDRPRAEAIAKALEDYGWSVWWDRDIRADHLGRAGAAAASSVLCMRLI